MPPEAFTTARILDAAEAVGVDEDALVLDAFTVQTFWIRTNDISGEMDQRWFFASADETGARQVTGVRFQ